MRLRRIAYGRPPGERVSDADREAVVEQLRSHAVAGRLTLDELDARAAETYAARTVGDLAAIVHDLPRDGAAAAPRGLPRAAWHLPVAATACGVATTAVVAHVDGGFRGLFDGVAAVPLWATVAFAGLAAARAVTRRTAAALGQRVAARLPRAGA
ncbi:MAG TPA: DUF1707 domain-containing protein [Gaiellaceae bacterium]|nr:DUF1707 domain-containing protein [Gaiellaceae bacterium]